MGSRRRLSWPLVVAIAACMAPVHAQQPKDIKGSSDHPRISRFEGAVISRYSAAAFDRLVLPLSTIGMQGPLKSQEVGGPTRRIIYRIPDGHNSHEVFRTYEAALKKDGFQTLHTCVGDRQCGNRVGEKAVGAEADQCDPTGQAQGLREVGLVVEIDGQDTAALLAQVVHQQGGDGRQPATQGLTAGLGTDGVHGLAHLKEPRKWTAASPRPCHRRG